MEKVKRARAVLPKPTVNLRDELPYLHAKILTNWLA